MEKIIYIPKNISTENLNYISNLCKTFDFIISDKVPKEEFFLFWENNYLSLQNNKNKIFVDFNNSKLQYRIKRINHEKISKIVNKNCSLICDATAGLGTDAFIIANLNLKIHLFENNPFIAILLKDGINRAKNKYINNMDLKFGSFYKYYCNKDIKPDIIYLDPMFPNNNKSSLSNKKMEFFKYVVGIDNDCQELVKFAFQMATKKIIIKRPLKADFIINKKPNHQYFGRAIRYDVYLPCKN